MLKKVGKFLRSALCAAALVSPFVVPGVSAQVPRDFAVEVTAAIQTAPPQVRLVWPADANATGYTISRKAPTATTWTSLTSLAGSATGYTDGNVAYGNSYEYKVIKSSSLGITAYGYIVAGIDAPAVESRGKLILVVDNTHASELASELTRLQQDITGDGWTVIRHDVSPTATVASVKSLIKADYDADRANVKSVLLFGHVPVPRSGDINPDGHPNHIGAWAADTYYADMDGSWTDSSVNDTTAERSANWNTPGDGKFDQSQIPSDLELAVGRVDLSNMTCFSNKTPSRSEVDLLRAYLNKDHNFRTGSMSVPRRGLVADNFGYIYGEAYASTGFRSFAPMFGSTNTTELAWGTYFPTLSTQPYLFSYACGGGDYYSCAGIGGSDDFALNNVQAVFTMHFGSYFGDWDNESNFLRAPLGSGYVLTTTWSGRPIYFYHHMALGETIGYSVRLSQNNGSGGTYLPQYYGSRYVNSVLMGDPTLRLHPVLPPSNLTGGISGSSLVLSWTGSSDTAIKGYNIYRAATAAGPFTRLNSTLLGATTFTDTAPIADGVYMVRAVKLESTPSGTYYNPSQGVFFTNTGSPAAANASKFVKFDTATRGNWKGIYGGEGNWLAGNAPMTPFYATITTGAPKWTWASLTTNPVAPVLPGASADRVAACWFSATQVDINISVTDGRSHRVSLYFMDWTASGRQQRVDLIDRTTGAVLDARSLADFASGIYLTWDIVGTVTIRLTPANVSAVASAVFFDSPTAIAHGSARFVAMDSATKGNWKGVYGIQGNWVLGASSAIPSYAMVNTAAPQWVWAAQTTSSIAPYLPGASTNRIAACWFSATQANLDLSITDGNSHRVSIYFMDWTNSGRQERVDLIDRTTGAVLDTRTLTNFAGGVYLSWDVGGPVTVRLTPANVSAVASAIFFD